LRFGQEIRRAPVADEPVQFRPIGLQKQDGGEGRDLEPLGQVLLFLGIDLEADAVVLEPGEYGLIFPSRLIELSARQAPRRVEIHQDDALRLGCLRTSGLETASEERFVGPTVRCQEQSSENGRARQQLDVNHRGSSDVLYGAVYEYGCQAPSGIFSGGADRPRRRPRADSPIASLLPSRAFFGRRSPLTRGGGRAATKECSLTSPL